MRTFDEDSRAGATAATAMPRPGTTQIVLRASGVQKSYRTGALRRQRPVLLGVDLSIGTEEVVGLVGENGSGKSTLIKILVGLMRPDAGEVSSTGTVGFCPQEPVLYPRLTCDEHVDLFAEAYGMTSGARDDARDALYAALDFGRYSRARAEHLSGGTASKLNLALALLPDPPLLLLDEPYAGFDWDTYQKFWGIVAERRARGCAVLIVSHFAADAERFDRIAHLRDGRVH